jgi:hypothetical protein
MATCIAGDCSTRFAGPGAVQARLPETGETYRQIRQTWVWPSAGYLGSALKSTRSLLCGARSARFTPVID